MPSDYDIAQAARGGDEIASPVPGSVQWAEKHGRRLFAANGTASDISSAIAAAYNTGLRQAAEASETHTDIKDIPTRCLHMMICDGDTDEPITFADEN